MGIRPPKKTCVAAASDVKCNDNYIATYVWTALVFISALALVLEQVGSHCLALLFDFRHRIVHHHRWLRLIIVIASSLSGLFSSLI